jgi:hypothetical protein
LEKAARATKEQPALYVLKTFTPESVAGVFATAITQFADTRVVLVADSLLLRRVALLLSDQHRELNVDRLGRLPGDTDTEDFGPVYPLAFAVPTAANRWREMLRVAQVAELFENDAETTADMFAKLMLTEPLCIWPLPLESQLPDWTSRRFGLHALLSLCNLYDRLPEDTKEDSAKRAKAAHLLQACARVWAPGRLIDGKSSLEEAAIKQFKAMGLSKSKENQ